jgi:hypothetical protein
MKMVAGSRWTTACFVVSRANFREQHIQATGHFPPPNRTEPNPTEQGGCDGAEKSRKYYSQLGTSLPKETLILTLGGCGLLSCCC